MGCDPLVSVYDANKSFLYLSKILLSLHENFSLYGG